MSLKESVAFERGQVVLAVVSALIGGVIGWVIPKLFEDPTRLELWIVCAVSLLAFGVATANVSFLNFQRKEATAALERVVREVEQMGAANKEIQELVEDSIGRQAALIPRELVYHDMATAIRNAQHEVAVITYLMADWDTGRRTFVPATVDTPYRGEFYDAVYEAIRNPRIEYVRVWQVPHDCREKAPTVIRSDQHHAKEWDLIKEVEKARPDRARLIITTQLTTASFILIDRRHLFLNIDFYDAQKKVWYSPYMLFVKDATSEAFEALQGVIVRLVNPVD